MATGATAGRGSARDEGDAAEEQNRSGQDDGGETGKADHNQELSIIIFKGHPTRIDLHVADNSNNTTLTFRLEGEPGSHWVSESRNQPVPWSRVLKKLHVASVATNANNDLRDVILSCPLQFEESEENCQAWIGVEMETLEAAELITTHDGNRAVDIMVDTVYEDMDTWQR